MHVGGIWLVMMTVVVRQQEVSKLQGHYVLLFTKSFIPAFIRKYLVSHLPRHFNPLLPAYCMFRSV